MKKFNDVYNNVIEFAYLNNMGDIELKENQNGFYISVEYRFHVWLGDNLDNVMKQLKAEYINFAAFCKKYSNVTYIEYLERITP